MKERSFYFCLQIPLKLASASSKQIGGGGVSNTNLGRMYLWFGTRAGDSV